MIFVGVDWAEAHHDLCVLDQAGAVLGRRRGPDGVAGVAQLHALVADHAEEPSQVVVGIELDRGLLVGALVGAGYQVVAVNPLAASRYRERHAVSGAKSDPCDAKVLADLVRTDRHNHRLVAGDPRGPRPSGCWPGPISRPSGAANASSTAYGRRCVASTLRPWKPSGRTWPAGMGWQ